MNLPPPAIPVNLNRGYRRFPTGSNVIDTNIRLGRFLQQEVRTTILDSYLLIDVLNK